MRRLHIAYVITQSDSIGGASIHVRDLASAMLEEGHQVEVLVGGNGPFVEMLKERQVPVISIPHLVRQINPLWDWKAYKEIKEALKGLKPDIVHAHSSKAGVLGRYAASSLGFPSLFTAHGFSFTEGVHPVKRQIYKWVEKAAARRGNGIIAVSEYDRQLAIKEGVCRPDQIVTIHNGIPDIPPELMADPSIQPPRLVMVARFDKQKNHRLLLETLAELQELPWHLELIGDGPLRGEMENLAKRLGLGERVTFSGTCNDVAERLAKCQFFLLISNWEGLPLTIIEAMRAGLPVICSDVGGCFELMRGWGDGQLLTANHKQHLKRFLGQMILSSSVRKEQGRKARTIYKKCYVLERMREKVENFYRSHLTGNTGCHLYGKDY